MRNYTPKTPAELLASYALAAERRRATCAIRRAALDAARRADPQAEERRRAEARLARMKAREAERARMAAADAADPLAAIRRIQEGRRMRKEKEAARAATLAAQGLDGSGRPLKLLYLPAPAVIYHGRKHSAFVTVRTTILSRPAIDPWSGPLKHAGRMDADTLALALVEEPERAARWRASFVSPLAQIPGEHWRFYRWEEWVKAWEDPAIPLEFRRANAPAVFRPKRWGGPLPLPA
jgi:hypothetical protein